MTPFVFGPPPATKPGDQLIRVPARLQTKKQLLDALRVALSLPDYFGHNWDALEECLADLSWLPKGKILLAHDDLPLSHEPAERITYLQVLKSAASARLVVTFPPESRAEVEKILP